MQGPVSQQSAAREQLLDALERTVGNGSARIEFRYQLSLPDDFYSTDSRSSRARGGAAFDRLTRRLASLLGRVFLWGLRRLVDRWSRELAAQREPGVIDFAAHRCA